MLTTAKQFEPESRLTETIRELDKTFREAGAILGRMEWLRLNLVREIEQLRAERDMLEIYTEAEAAALIRIEVKHLADLRRRLDLPHCSFGNKPRYTKGQLVEICSILEIRSKGRAALKRAA